MKNILALLLLVAFNASAFYKVEVVKGNKNYKAEFETEALADAWIEKQKQERSWGKLDRWEQSTDGTHTNTREVEYEAQVVIDDVAQFEEDGVTPKMETKTRTEYFFPQEFTVTKKDITVEKQAEAQAKADRKADIQQIKQAFELIQQDDTLKPYLKKLLKRLVLEMEE
jgi:LPS O-antigen subunit length determinant protein (WzzB/FepE family)